MNATLHIVMYHYIRDLPRTSFPRIKGMLTSDFRKQLSTVRKRYEMATLESALDFIHGTYVPSKDLCLLTFDDGLKEHYTDVTPLLADHHIQGIFFPISWCLEERRVASVHMNHFLMASLDFDVYRSAFLDRLSDAIAVDPSIAQRTYRWDPPEVASFKYLFNFLVDADSRDAIVKSIFAEHFPDEKAFANGLYIDWHEARAMQEAGMVIGGHSHRHKPLSTLPEQELGADLKSCHKLLTRSLYPQPFWPFSYPYGKSDSFNGESVRQLQRLGFACSFSTEVGSNAPGADIFALLRLDCKDAPA
jgi:peptidoglycan/xylan/chitin deacetylase (PgdA/CDA1 family)